MKWSKDEVIQVSTKAYYFTVKDHWVDYILQSFTEIQMGTIVLARVT